MSDLTGLLFTHPVPQDKRATEIWIKFRNSAQYVFIDFEQPFPEKIEVLKLIGSGNALDCSDYKKDNELLQYNERNMVMKILDESRNFRGNISETVEKTKNLFSDLNGRFLHY